MIGRPSDRARGAKIAAAAGALVLLALYANRVGPRAYPSYDEARRDPAAFADREIIFGGDIEAETAGGFVVRTWDGFAVAARGALAAGQVGYRISGRAIFRADGTLDVLASHVYRYRLVKNLLAVLPVIVVVWAFLRRYAFDARRFAFRKRLRGGEARDA
jgi:hypothetical protein